MYDTLTYVKKLESVGIPRHQAEAQVEIMSEIVDSNYATKHAFCGYLLKIILVGSTFFSVAAGADFTKEPREEIARKVELAELGYVPNPNYNLNVENVFAIVRRIIEKNTTIPKETIAALKIRRKNGPTPKELLPGTTDRFGGSIDFEIPIDGVLRSDSFDTKASLIWQAGGKTSLYIAIQNFSDLYQAQLQLCDRIDELSDKVCGLDQNMQKQSHLKLDLLSLKPQGFGVFADSEILQPVALAQWPVAKSELVPHEQIKKVYKLARSVKGFEMPESAMKDEQVINTKPNIFKIRTQLAGDKQTSPKKNCSVRCETMITVDVSAKKTSLEKAPCSTMCAL